MYQSAEIITNYAPTSSLSVEEVRAVRHWNDRLFSFTITRPPSFRFRSGEFVMVGLSEEDRPLLRAYSIASPAWAEELEFLSIKIDDGPLTSRLQNIGPGDSLYLGRKPTGTLVADALRPGKRLFLFGSGTGLAPFMSLVRDPDIYDRFEQIVLVHCVRNISDLAYRADLENRLLDDPLVHGQANVQLHYVPTVTREAFHTMGRIGTLVEKGVLFDLIPGARSLDPALDRIMLCGSMAMIRDLSQMLLSQGFEEGSNARPADFVIERAFVG
ncbi:ferredoxin--NADP reductase [Sphingobium sp. V4]|uniref:ferredoxin--NADP reductase n=1 Tax=Sphingobium sp. V4 TaxID=3038927 RepID=UPI002557EC9E|nr:ferredoxin--NADP reductase [Sphingobium sp. V4]WIW89528.1 ferredoxin--NADP reductase [Sphingobium sp. V4]